MSRVVEKIIRGDAGLAASLKRKVENPVEELAAALGKAVEKSTQGIDSFAVFFSGGLDSSLVAKLCENLSKRAVLYSAGMKGSKDFDYVQRAKAHFKSEIKYRELALQEVEAYAKKVVAAIKDASPMQVAIGAPLYALCEAAAGDGLNLALCGQGGDELFAGYQRYLRMGEKELEEALLHDLTHLYPANLKRDLAIAEANRVRLLSPYLDEEVVSIAVSLPPSLKIKNGVRKYVLREVAKKASLPEFIAAREKKALQYSTGVDRALRGLAKKNGKTIEQYLRELAPSCE